MELVLQTKTDYIESMFIKIYQKSWIEGTYEYKKRKAPADLRRKVTVKRLRASDMIF